MVIEKLPIKFFAAREQDNLRVEGGGSGQLPSWVLDGVDLENRSINLIQSFKNLSKPIEQKEKDKSIIPLILKVDILEDASAKTHRQKISNLLRIGESNNVLGLAEENELIFKIDNIYESKVILDRLSNFRKYSYALSCVENIEKFYPFIIKDDKRTAVDYKIKLLDFQNYELNHSIQKLFENTIFSLGLNFKRTDYAPDYPIYNLKSITEEALDFLGTEEIFESIFSIEPMPQYEIETDFLLSEHVIDIKYPKNNKGYVTVGILDSGIKEIKYLKPWLTQEKWSVYPEEYIDRSHGTFVAGIVIYGDDLEENIWVNSPGCKIFDANVFPAQNEFISEDELIRNIQEVVKENYEKVKIWNLSLGKSKTINRNCFSDFAIALDNLQKDFNILICKSAGNCSNYLTGHPKSKINEGADSIMSITVGSIAHKKSLNDIAEIDNPSPFSKIGRGPSFIIKPEVVHYGGNSGISDKGEQIITGVNSFDINGNKCCSAGTSFSTPRITSLAAGLYQEIEEEFDPLFIKGLIIHSAKYSDLLKLPNCERINQVGFGKPKSVNEIIYNSPNEATLILRDEIPKGEFIDIMDFPMPNCLIEDGYYQGQIIVTLTSDPILEPSQRHEYCQSDIEIKMGTYDGKKDRDTTRSNIINPIGRDGSQNLLLESCYSKRKIGYGKSDFALKERLLIQYADKYYPIKKYAIDLSEINDSFREKFLTQEKKWYLLLKGLFRENIEIKGMLEGKIPSQNFCLLVTLRDPSGIKPVYDQVSQKLNEYNFWHSNIKLRSDIELHV